MWILNRSRFRNSVIVCGSQACMDLGLLKEPSLDGFAAGNQFLAQSMSPVLRYTQSSQLRLGRPLALALWAFPSRVQGGGFSSLMSSLPNNAGFSVWWSFPHQSLRTLLAALTVCSTPPELSNTRISLSNIRISFSTTLVLIGSASVVYVRMGWINVLYRIILVSLEV